MKITFVGSSHGVPEPNQRCTCVMIEINSSYYFLDMGTPAIDALVNRGIPINSVKGIFITHMHGDHTNGLIQFVDLCSWYFKAADPVICLPKIEGRDAIEGWLKVTGTKIREFQYRKVEEGVVFDDGVLKVTAVKTLHCDVSFAYLFEAEGKAILFTGDQNREPSTDFPKIAYNTKLDLLVGEGAHFAVTEYEPLLKNCDVKRVILSHVAPWNIPNVQTLAKALPELNIVRATDGLEVSL